MKKRLDKQLSEAKNLIDESRIKGDSGSFADELAALSLAAHVQELEQLVIAEESKQFLELVDFRLQSQELRNGSAPLSFVSNAAEEIRKMIGYAALRLIQGGLDRKRVPVTLYDDLDLQLAGIFPGSTRLLVSAKSDRDLLDSGLAKGALERIFDVLDSNGRGEEFLESITDLGSLSARHLREFLNLLNKFSAEAEFSWDFAGKQVRSWGGSSEKIRRIVSALEVVEIKEQEIVRLYGQIEMLSARQRIDIRTIEGSRVRVMYSRPLFETVTKLHIDQEATFECKVTQTDNSLTQESSTFYELIAIHTQ